MNILVTGASGFIGNSLIEMFLKLKISVTGVVRSEAHALSSRFIVVDLAKNFDLTNELIAFDVVIHCAAFAGADKASVAEVCVVNVDSTKELVRQSSESGVQKFIYISTVKVHGENDLGVPIKEDDALAPSNAYSKSKVEAERMVIEGCKAHSMNYVVVRPVMVFGPGRNNNFYKLARRSVGCLSFMLAGISNKRSVVSIYNLVDFIYHCSSNAGANNNVFFVSDGGDISTGNLVKHIHYARTGKKLTICVPLIGVKFALRLMGQADVVNKVFGDLRVNISKARDLLSWVPKYSTCEAVKMSVENVRIKNLDGR